MNKKRNESTTIIFEHNLEQAKQILAEIARLKRNIAAVESDMNNSICRIRNAANAFAKPRRERLHLLVESLAMIAEKNKEHAFCKKRSIATPFGNFGFRRSKEIRPTKDQKWGEVLERIQKYGLQEAIRIRVDINRERLHEWPDALLKKVGAMRVEKDSFWYELREDALPIFAPEKSTGEVQQ